MISLVQLLLVTIGSLSALTEAVPVTKGKRLNCNAGNGKAIYFLTNNQQNAVVALPIGADGTLSNGTVTGTNGAGSNSIDGATNSSAGPDALVGQAALTVTGQVSGCSERPDSFVQLLNIHSVSLRSQCRIKHIEHDGHLAPGSN
jgi:hypothetical protein